MFGNLGWGELLVILLIVLLLFGARRLPELAKGIGKSLKAFKDGLKESTKDAEDVKKTISEIKDEAQKDL